MPVGRLKRKIGPGSRPRLCVRSLLEKHLAAAGYAVLSAANSRVALETAQNGWRFLPKPTLCQLGRRRRLSATLTGVVTFRNPGVVDPGERLAARRR
jgi:hypothetical protein